MAPSTGRWRDIVLNPCNQSAERRNWAATKDALQSLADQPVEPTAVAGSDLRFFQVITSNIGGDSCQVREVSWNSGTSAWDTLGDEFEAFDWTPDGVFKQNFVEDFYGVGRLNENVGAKALEIIAIEGYARFIQGTATGGMSGGTATISITDYWGDPLNGRSPGASATVHDKSNNAPNLSIGDKVIAAFDEKRQLYVLVAPHKSSQPPGNTALVEVRGGSGCTSVSENALCVYTGKKMEVSAQALLDETFCDEQFDAGQDVWILDARNCRSIERLQDTERYVAVSMLDEWDPDPEGSSDPRPLYAVVDATPSIRWFKVFTNAEAIVQDGSPNDLRCRDCNDDDTKDDCPSVWGKWIDVNPCEFDAADVSDPSGTLIYFPFHKLRCSPVEEQVANDFDECLDSDVDPYCRNSERVCAFYNPISQRWEALTDILKCTNLNGMDFQHVMICDVESISSCCLYDAVKIKYSPQDDSWCFPKTEREKVWVRCVNGFSGNLPLGYCKLAAKVCNNFECEGENRPVYQFECGRCLVCNCPDECGPVQFSMFTDNPSDDCGSMISEVKGILRCVDSNPILGGINPGFYGEFSYMGLEPRILYGALADFGTVTNELIYLEIACGGTGHTAGTILGKYWFPPGSDEPEGFVGSVTFKSGLIACLPYQDAEGNPRFRPRSYRYGLWARCGNDGEVNGIAEVQVYWLKNEEMVSGLDEQTIDPNCSAGCENPPSATVVATQDALWGSGSFEDQSACCANSHVYEASNGPAMECQQDLSDVPIIGLPGGLDEGLLTCPTCFTGRHPFIGCTCFVIGGDELPGFPGYVPANGWQCSTYITPCHAIKWFVQLEWTMNEGTGPPIV